MKVILLERVGRMGHIGDEVTVKDGFARNFLLPREKALRATTANRKVFEGRRADLEASNAKAREGASKAGERLVGQVAKRQAITNSENTIFSIKRFMGRRSDEVSEEQKMVPYKVIRGDNGDARVEALGTKYSPPEISAMILTKLKEAAEAYLSGLAATS